MTNPSHPNSPGTTDGAPRAEASAQGRGVEQTTTADGRVVHPNRVRRVKTALTAFSITAYITGVMLLVLVAEMIYKYLILDDSADAPGWFFFVAQLHGFAYMAFLIAIVNLGTKARWTPGKWIITALGGVVPFLSFYVERKRSREVKDKFGIA